MRALITLALLAPTVADAAPTESARDVTLTDAIPGKTLHEAIEAAVRHDDTCYPDCTFAVDKTLTLPDGLRFAVQHATNTTFDSTGYVVTFSSDAGVWLWSTDDAGEFRNPAVSVIAESSGMGKSLNEKLERITILRSPHMVWVRFVVSSSLTYRGDGTSRPSSSKTHLEYVIGCRYDGTPRCAAVTPSARDTDLGIVIAAPVAIVRYADYDGKPHVDRVTFTSP